MDENRARSLNDTRGMIGEIPKPEGCNMRTKTMIIVSSFVHKIVACAMAATVIRDEMVIQSVIRIFRRREHSISSSAIE